MDSFFNISKLLSLWLVVFSFVANIDVSRACPSTCVCGYLGNSPYINCEKKNLREFPKNINRNTEILRFRHNNITRLPEDFASLVPNLKTLSIEQNRIQYLPDGIFSNLRNLQEVFISYNRIKWVGKRLFANSAAAPRSYIRFDLEGNLLKSLAEGVFGGCSAKFYVNWKSNLIETFQPGVFAGAEGVHHLNLEDNRIKTLSPGIFKDLTKMYFLGLGNNNLSKIESGVFQGLHRLETLTLQKNLISSLAPDAFQDLSNAKYINLESNLFTKMPREAIQSLPSISKIKLKKNPIKCTCKLKNDLSSIKDKIIDLNFIHCTNINKTVEEAIKDVNCVTEAAPTSAVHSTTEATFPLSTGKIANEVIDTTSSKTGTADKNNVITRKHPEKDSYGSRTPLPLIIGVAIGSFIIFVVIILFVYLYRRPIARRAASTMSLPRKKSRNDTKNAISYKKSPCNDYSTDYNI